MEEPPDRRTNGRHVALLVAGDDPPGREALRRRLEARGVPVSVLDGGEDGLAAVDVLGLLRPDLLLLDATAPGARWESLLVAIRERWEPAELPVVVVTPPGGPAADLLARGASDVLTGPLDVPLAVARIRSVLALREAQDEVRRLSSHLAAAQERIAQLAAAGPEAFHDFGRWARSVADELSESLAADAIGVFLLEGDDLRPVSGGTATVPPLSEARAALAGTGAYEGEQATVVAIRSPRGDLLGAVSAEGGPRPRAEIDLGLLTGFAHQLGGALEMRRLREEASASARRRAAQERQTERLWVCPACGRCSRGSAACPEDGALPGDPHEVPRRLLDRYDLRRVLGEGGMGTVFEARDERLGRDVALKIIKPEHLHSAPMRQRLEREARAIARIEHPGVVALFDSGDLGDGSLFLVMERLHGADLAELFRLCGPGTPWQVARLVRQGTAALAAAHRHGIVHRDIKPDNVILVDGPDGLRVKLVDFGLAVELGQDVRVTRSGLIVGTPAYMAPEQVAGRPVDERADVYSFGAVAYQALVGRGVTVECELDRVFVDVLQTVPPRVSDLLPGTPAVVDEAFAAALAKLPDERPRDIEAWGASFARLLEEMPARTAGWALPLGGGYAARRRHGTLPRASSAGG